MSTSAHATHYSTLSSMFGGCACGLLRYRLLKPPMIVHCCHCTSCQRETGTAFALNAIIESDQVEALPPAAPTVPGSAASPDALPAGPAMAEWTGPVGDGGVVEPIMVDLPSESGNCQRLARCPRCFTVIWSHYSGGSPFLKFIRVGTLDEAYKITPDVHIFTRSARTDVVELKGVGQDRGDGVTLQAFEAFYQNFNEVYRPDGYERFMVILPKLKERSEKRKAEKEAARRELAEK